MARQIVTQWVTAWAGGDGSCVAGSRIDTLYRYEDGHLELVYGTPRYLHDHTEDILAHRIFLLAESDLRAGHFKEKDR